MVGSELNRTRAKRGKKRRGTGSPLVFCVLNFSPAEHYLNAWNRLMKCYSVSYLSSVQSVLSPYLFAHQLF